MKNNTISWQLLCLASIVVSCLGAQTAIPVRVINNTGLPDDSIYVAIVGEDLTGPPGKHIWVNVLTGEQIPMDDAYNTVDSPEPGDNTKYANCFQPLSVIPNHTIPLKFIQGCRVFISQKQHLYLHFFDPAQGYSAPDLNNPSDPNLGIVYEIIELTYNSLGFFGNTTRVDAYQRPMVLEVFGHSEADPQKRGETASHQAIISAFQTSMPPEFGNCLRLQDSIILQPSKTEDFKSGPHKDYFNIYVDSIWDKYKNQDLIFDGGQIGTWRGRVDNLDSLIFECIQGDSLGRKGRIARKPTTLEIIEGSGVLADGGDNDKNVQKHVCAAINRHVINVSPAFTGSTSQIWSDPATYYLHSPANFYAGFWHRQGISINRLSYGFAYDDVFDQSSTLQTTDPDSIRVYFGGLVLTTSSSETEKKPHLKAFPSTTGDYCTVSGLDKSNFLCIFDIRGRLLESTRLDPGQDSVEIDLSNYAKGAYFIQARSESRTGLVKVIKI